MVKLCAWILGCFIVTPGLTAEVNPAQGRTLTLVGDKWCPFNCAEHPEHRGFLVELAATVLAEEGYQVEYIEVPWSRAILGVREGQYDAIVGAGLNETPDFHFPSEPLAFARHSFFTLPTTNWHYEKLASLDEIRIGVIQDYSYGGLYENYVREHQLDESRVIILRGNEVLPRLVEMLRMDRIDALVAEERVLDFHLTSTEQDNSVRNAGLANEEALFVAFSPAIADGEELAAALGRGLKKLRQGP